MRQKLLLLSLLAILLAPTLAGPKTLVNHDFKNADLVHVLKLLAKEMGYQLYLGPSVQGKVTLKLENVPAEEALRRVLAQHPGLDYSRTAKALVVGTAEKLEEISDATLGAPEPEVMRRPKPTVGPKRRSRGGVFNTESYDHIAESGFQKVSEQPLSTFSIDVDTAAYSNVRRFLQKGQKPPKDAVRVEEMVNYFAYDFPTPKEGEPFSVSTELSNCPWNPGNQLLQVALSAPELKLQDTPPRNLVFLLDVSGSMASPKKLPLVQSAARLLVKTMRPQDHVAIVVYAGASGMALAPTSGSHQDRILSAIDSLEPGGSTNGAAGIELAYQLAAENYQANAINRVILATDGDFNVGVSSRGGLVRLIEEKRKSGIFLTVLGFGSGNLKDSSMEQLADKGNGNYAYIDTLMEAKKVLIEEGGATLVTVAKDVKLQLEFNPLKVASYRLIGYENRRLNNEDFGDDKKDAGEMGAGHTVTALYEIVPGQSGASNLRYQEHRSPTEAARSSELALVKVRYKQPQADTSLLREFTVKSNPLAFAKSSENLRFAASVASVGMLLRDSEFKGKSSYQQALKWAQGALGQDLAGYRREFVRLVELAQAL